eukprot:2953864-Pyramimonas_sp.AAC.1
MSYATCSMACCADVIRCSNRSNLNANPDHGTGETNAHESKWLSEYVAEHCDGAGAPNKDFRGSLGTNAV